MIARYQCSVRVWPNLPTAEFCAPKTRLAADRQWNSAYASVLLKSGMLYRFLIDKTLITCLYKHTARLPQAGPEAAAFQEGENSVSDAPMVNKSAETDLRATKMLFDMLKEVQQKAGAAALEPAKLTAPDSAVVEQFAGRLRRQIADEAAETAADRAADPSR